MTCVMSTNTYFRRIRRHHSLSRNLHETAPCNPLRFGLVSMSSAGPCGGSRTVRIAQAGLDMPRIGETLSAKGETRLTSTGPSSLSSSPESRRSVRRRSSQEESGGASRIWKCAKRASKSAWTTFQKASPGSQECSKCSLPCGRTIKRLRKLTARATNDRSFIS